MSRRRCPDDVHVPKVRALPVELFEESEDWLGVTRKRLPIAIGHMVKNARKRQWAACILLLKVDQPSDCNALAPGFHFIGLNEEKLIAAMVQDFGLTIEFAFGEKPWHELSEHRTILTIGSAVKPVLKPVIDSKSAPEERNA